MDGIIQTFSRLASSTWSADAADKSYHSAAWAELVRDLYNYTLSEARRLKYSNVTELNEAEIAVIIQRKFEELNQKKDPLLSTFVSTLNFALDENLTKYLETTTLHSVTHRSNVQHLQNTVSKEIIHILDKSPPEFMANSKLFLNRGIPSSLRAALWIKGLGVTKDKLDSLLFHRLAPSLDVSISRRCYGILESYFPAYSNQSNANVLKTITVNFFRKRDFTISNTPECMDFIEKYIITLIPLLITFHLDDLVPLFDTSSKSGSHIIDLVGTKGRENNKGKLKSNDSLLVSGKPLDASDINDLEQARNEIRQLRKAMTNEGDAGGGVANSSSSSSSGNSSSSSGGGKVGGAASEDPATATALQVTSGEHPQQIGAVATSTLSRGFSWTQDDIIIKVIDKALEVLLGNKFFGGMQDVKRFSLKFSLESKRLNEIISPLATKTLALLEMKQPLLYDCLKDATLHAHVTVGETFTHAVRKESFEEFLQQNISVGLSLLLPLETLLFVWDNCIIAGAFEVLPLIMVSIIIGNADDMIEMKSTANAIQSLRNFCAKLPVANLKRLVAENCFQEIRELFVTVPISNTYDLCLENNEIIIQTIFKQFFSD